MITLESLPKTETYLGRKEYNEKFPNEKDHINLTKLIDSFIKVAIHMRNKLKEEPYLEFDDYVAIYGVNIITSDGILETEGGWKDEKLYPFFEWTDEYKDSYGLRQGKVLKAIFDVLSKDKVDDSKIVSFVEDIDMSFNS